MKRKVLGVAFLLVIQAVGLGQLTAQGAAPGVAQSFGAANTTTTTTLLAPGSATGAGDLLVAVIKVRNTTSLATVSSVADSASNVWSKAAGVTQGTQADMEVWYTPNAASVTSVTVTVTAASALAFTVLDVTGALAAPLDKTATLAGSSTAPSTGTTATTTQASEIAVAGIGWNGTATPNGQTAGYATTPTQNSTATGSATAEQASWEILSATGTQTYGTTLSASAAWTGAIATFKLGASAAPTITSFNPTSGPEGTSVKIAGSGFTGATAVAFNGMAATYQVDSDIQISTTVPSGATTGTIQVSTPGGNATSTTLFTVTPTGGVWAATYSVGATPTSWGISQTQTYSVTITNTGSLTWPAAGSNPVHLGVHFANAGGGAGNNTWYTDQRFSLPADLYAGDSVTLSIAVTAPTNTGNLVLEYQMVKEQQFWFAQFADVNVTVNGAVAPPHIMLIVMENREYGSIIGSSNAPYINSLAATYRSATKWYAVQHNSPHDYVQLLAGSDLGLPNGVPYSNQQHPTVVDELHATGIPWQAYMESMPSNCFKGTTADGLYDSIHNPFHYFTNYTTQSGGWCNSANLSTEGVLPYPGSTALVSTLNGANAPAFVWITPNDCHNMHGDTNTGSTCASSTTNQLTKAGDTWLSSNLGPVISSQWFSQNGIIIITWDEGTTNLGCCGLTTPGGHIATIVISSNNKGKGNFTSTGDNYGTLAAIEKAYGLTPLLGNSAFPIHGDLGGAF